MIIFMRLMEGRVTIMGWRNRDLCELHGEIFPDNAAWWKGSLWFGIGEENNNWAIARDVRWA